MSTSPIEDGANVTPSSLRLLAESLRKMADKHDVLAADMETAGIPTIYAKNLKSAVMGLINLSKFIGAATTSYCDHEGAKGVAELEGGMALFRRYLKRTADEVTAFDKAKARLSETIAEETQPKRAKSRK